MMRENNRFDDLTSQMYSQRNLNDLLKNIPVAVCLYHFQNGHLDPIVVSERYSEMLGTDAYEALESTEQLEFQHVHPEDLKRVQQKVWEALTETYQLDDTYRSYNEKLERYIWINVQGKAVPQADGTAYAYVVYTDITRDKEIEQKLRANEQILEAATKNADVWYWNCHWRQNIAYMGKRFQDDFELPEELHNFCESMCECDIIDPQYHQNFQKMCEKITAGETEAEVVVKGYFPDRTTHWMKFKMANIFDENHVAQEAVGIMHLVDDMKEMERKYEMEKRHAAEDKNLLAHFCINVSSWKIVDYAGSYLVELGNQSLSVEGMGQAIAAESLDEYAKQQILQMHDRAYLLNAFADGNTEFSVEYQRMLADGRCIWVSSIYHMINDQNSTDILLFEYCYNINLRKTMDILMDYAVNDDYDLMGLVNMQNQKEVLIYGKNSYNPGLGNIAEDDYQESLIRFTENAIVEEEREWYRKTADIENVAKYLETNENLEFYFHMINAEGEVRAKKVHYQRFKQDANSIVFIQSDITQLIKEQKKSQEKLEQALSDAKVASTAKTSFLSQMSHEIRTPMNAIIGMTKLAKQAEDQTEVTQYLNQIDASSQYLLGILNDILDMSRIESGKLELHPQWIDGCQLVMECIEMLKPAMEKKHLHFIYPKILVNSRLRFYLDPLRMQQIYMNLLNNAIKFTPEGGTIELSMKNLSHDDRFGRDEIRIRDTGCGMSKDFMTRIFQPFEMEENEFSTQVQGTGLGLALVKSYLDKMGGTIRVESELHKGSTFIFELPYEARFVDVEPEGTRAEQKVALCGKRILLVDDHPLNREIAKKLLEHEEAEVVVAVDGVDACEKFEHSQTDYYDAILMDIRMPKMNGLEAAKKIRGMKRSDAKHVPIIAMTANAFDEDTQKSMKAGMNAHLAKPIEPEKLMQTLEQYIRN